MSLISSHYTNVVDANIENQDAWIYKERKYYKCHFLLQQYLCSEKCYALIQFCFINGLIEPFKLTSFEAKQQNG